MPRIPVARHPAPERNGDSQRQTRGDDWKFKRGEPNVLDELMESAKTFDSEGNELLDE